MTAPARECQPDTTGHAGPEGYAASLLQQAIWIEESVDGTVPPSQRLDLGDVDTDELRSAAQFIMQQSARIEELTKALEWQPIETAPRDGTRILAFGGGLGDVAEVVSYSERVGCWDAPNDTLDDTDHEPDGYIRPTHWMPLPRSPVVPLERSGGAT